MPRVRAAAVGADFWMCPHLCGSTVQGRGAFGPPAADVPLRLEKRAADPPGNRTKTDTGGRVRRRTKARERNLAKELGNIAP